jgi:hypothetical protein
VRTGSGFHAAYEVLGVRVCRKHISKVIDAASKMLHPGDRCLNDVDAVILLSRYRRNRGRTIKRDFSRALEKIGILEIPDPNLELNE